jgi:hypothetical protein
MICGFRYGLLGEFIDEALLENSKMQYFTQLSAQAWSGFAACVCNEG